MDHHRSRRFGGIVLASLVALSFAAIAKAQDRHAWFQSLMMPGTDASCCDISDCRRTEADWHDGHWWATVDGKRMSIPHSRELRRRSIDGDAYVCASPSRVIYCFVKPDMTM